MSRKNFIKKLQRHTKWLKKINPDYVIAIVAFLTVGGMSLKVPSLNKPCNQWLEQQHAAVSRQVKAENHQVFKMHAHHQIYRYSLTTYKDHNLARKIKALQKRKHSMTAHPIVHKQLVKKQNRIGKMKARLQILNGQHNLYLLNHPELKQYFKAHKLTKTYTTAMVKQNHADQKKITKLQPVLKEQHKELKSDVKHSPTVNMAHPRYDTVTSGKIFSPIVSWGAGMFILAFIGFCFMVHGFGYKRHQHKKEITHLYGDDKPEASD